MQGVCGPWVKKDAGGFRRLRLSIKSQTGKSKRKRAFFLFGGLEGKPGVVLPIKARKCCYATLLPYCANAALPYPMYADVRRLLVFVPFLTVWQRVKKFFDTLSPMSLFETWGVSFWAGRTKKRRRICLFIRKTNKCSKVS